MLTNIAAATQILANALKALDSLREQAKGSNDTALKENISKLYDSLLDLKAVVVRVQDENAALQRKIEQLALPLPEKSAKRTPNIRCLGAATSHLRQGLNSNSWYDDPRHEFQEPQLTARRCRAGRHAVRADIKRCWQRVEADGEYVTGGSGGLKPHPALQRLDLLRRDLGKVLASLGLQKPVPEDTTPKGPTLEDILNG